MASPSIGIGLTADTELSIVLIPELAEQVLLDDLLCRLHVVCLKCINEPLMIHMPLIIQLRVFVSPGELAVLPHQCLHKGVIWGMIKGWRKIESPDLIEPAVCSILRRVLSLIECEKNRLCIERPPQQILPMKNLL